MSERNWFIYGLTLEGSLTYIGVTQNLEQRNSAHKYMHGDDLRPSMFVIEHHDNEPDALEREKEIIKVLKPKGNVQFADKGAVKLVPFERHLPDGTTAPIKVRVREGMLMPEKAKSVWWGRSYVSARDALLDMPGWDRTKAEYIFGKRDWSL